jgi:hypothetical protein
VRLTKMRLTELRLTKQEQEAVFRVWCRDRLPELYQELPRKTVRVRKVVAQLIGVHVKPTTPTSET